MATEIYSNIFSTTLASNYTAASGTCTVNSMTGAPSATLGNWRLLLDRGGANVLLKVTAASGTTLTVTAEQNDANVSSGATADGVITTGSLDAIKADVLAQTGVVASVFIATNETTTSTSFVDLTTPDSVTFTLAQTSNVIVQYMSNAYSTGGTNNAMWNSIMVDGSLADDGNQSVVTDAANGFPQMMGASWRAAGLAAGSHTIKVQHKVGSNTGHWRDRMLTVTITP